MLVVYHRSDTCRRGTMSVSLYARVYTEGADVPYIVLWVHLGRQG